MLGYAWRKAKVLIERWRSMAEMIDHGFCEDLKDVAKKSITAGVNMEMQSAAYADHLESLVREGVIPMEMIDNAVANILRVKFQLGLFESPSPY